MKLYNAVTENINKLEVKIYASIKEVARILGVEGYSQYGHLKATLDCFCDYRLIGNTNKKKVDILEIYEKPYPNFHHHGDYSKLKCTEEEREHGGVYLIYSQEHGKYYSGSTYCLKKRFAYWKSAAKNGSKENGATALSFEDSIMIPLFIANENCTREQLYNVESNMIDYLKVTKREKCLNKQMFNKIQQSVEGIGVINWDLLCELGVFNRSYVWKIA